MPRLLFLVSDGKFFLSHRLPIARAAAEAGYDVAVASPWHDGIDDCRRCGIDYFTIPMLRGNPGLISDARAALSILSVLRQFKPDIVHLVSAKPIFYGGILSRMLGIPTVFAISGLGYVFTHDTRSLRLLRYLVLAGYKQAIDSPRNHVIFQNDDDMALFRQNRIIGSASCTIIRGSGVDLDRIRPKPLPEGDSVVMLPARMLRDKGVCEFVAAARILRNQGLSATFRLLGNPDPVNPTSIPAHQLQAWANEGVVQWQPHTDDMDSALAGSHVVVLPSYREGFPKTLIDAAAAGRAAATTDVPGCRDAIIPGVTGLLFKVRDPVDLARAIKPLIESRERQKLYGEAARKHAELSFDIKDVCRKHLHVYQAARDSRSRG